MTEQSSKPGGWQRAQNAFKHTKEAAKQAEVTIAVASHVLNPLAGPAAQQAHLEPVMDEQQYVQMVRDEDRRSAEDWYQYRLEQETGRLVRESAQDRQNPEDQQDRQDQQDRERRKSQERHRDRDR